MSICIIMSIPIFVAPRSGLFELTHLHIASHASSGLPAPGIYCPDNPGGAYRLNQHHKNICAQV